MLYASLIGPLLGIYYPIPHSEESVARVMLNTSKLSRLWCSIYSEKEVDALIADYGGIKLPHSFAKRLDYDAFKVQQEDFEILLRNASP